MPDDLPTENQIRIGNNLGIKLKGIPRRVGHALVSEFIDQAFGIKPFPSPSTEKQRNFAKKLGLDVAGFSKFVATAAIENELIDLNLKAIQKLKLKPGMAVRFSDPDFSFKENIRIVSSIDKNGMVYFKGGQGAKSWASKLTIV